MEDSAFGPAGANADLECRTYVAAPSRDRLLEWLAAALNVSLGPDRVISYGCVEVEWEHNDYEGTGADVEFLDWHSLLVCQPRRDASTTAVVSDTATVLEAVQEAGYRAAPVCGYEELLQKSGAGLRPA
ncbi:hypothetical protein [Streptomyces pilosus]|uniref:Uncharacterized protein n=1 Tax=Streptomyces pilosus TaxID=28893 RepID=A0A918C8K9_9ACTN|nr:hypothetical protein [Streptomyces pilosus]GGR08994.1 hypothetical protein GCM10010280_66010 [Streptomyces pilosus]